MRIYPVENNNFLYTIKIKITESIKKVFGTMINKNKAKAKTFLQQVLILLSRRKKKTFFILNTFFTKRKAIIQVGILGKKSQKTSIGLGNFHIDNYS